MPTDSPAVMPKDSPVVFISYAHSTDEHKQRVADLVQTLRAAGVKVMADTDVITPQGPEEQWPRWMSQRIEEADWVLIFFDEIYKLRFDGKEDPDKGHGATWEAAIIINELYRNATRNKKFIPLLADDADAKLVAPELSGATHYRIPKQAEKLAAVIMKAASAGSNETPSRPTSEISPTRLLHGAEHLFGRDDTLAELDEAWADPGTNIVTLVAWGGVGKTALLIEWMARRAKEGWPGYERVFDWSFYSQGTRDQGAVSADAFVAKALTFFGDESMADSASSAWDKGARLAKLIGEQATLLVLDGLEPLQYPPGPLAGKLKDPALDTLLKGLAQRNRGLCVLTTRESVTDLAPYHEKTAPEWQLAHLSDEAGAAMLHRAGATRAGEVKIEANDKELREASREVGGHALTLRILGNYLKLAHNGDVRKRSEVAFDQADEQYKTNPDDADKTYGHAFKVMGVYENWLGSGGKDGSRQLAVLRMMGLFDRPAGDGCIAALRAAPAIDGLTDPIVGLGDTEWRIALKRLADCGLITATDQTSAIDAHPLIREYFAKRLRENNDDGWRAGHKRLYEHLTTSTEDKPDAKLEDLQPLYQAVAHGCQAGLHQKICDEVYYARIARGNEHYAFKRLGAIGAELGAVACFFEEPWSRLAPAIEQADQAWLLGQAASHLMALGRLTEALEPIRASLDMSVDRADWNAAALVSNNLSELNLARGDVAAAAADAERSVTFADRGGDAFHRMARRATAGNALLQVGRRVDALDLFQESEAMQAKDQPGYALLYSFRGYQYCELLLAEAERLAWKCGAKLEPASNHEQDARAALIARCGEVERRAAQTLAGCESDPQTPILDFALDHLTLGRVALYRGLLTDSKTNHAEALQTARRELADALDGLRRSGSQDHVPRGLLSRGWLRFLEGDEDGARQDLAEAWEIAERGGMRLHMADVHLHRARLFRDVDSLAKAAELIAECGYGRRKEELADARQAAKAW